MVVKIRIGHIASFGLVILFTLVNGCEFPRTYGTFFRAGISPISPAMGYSLDNRYKPIDTLSPELKWRDLKKPNQTYEVGVWETPYRSLEDVKKKDDQFEFSWGALVYSTNNIGTNYHQMAITLKPDTYYNWSVRIREGDRGSAWSTFEQQKAVLSVITTHSGVPFAFKTPAH
jgi:hypothetical protein